METFALIQGMAILNRNLLPKRWRHSAWRLLFALGFLAFHGEASQSKDMTRLHHPPMPFEHVSV
ncbi:MAG: hypothetical protein RBT80_19950, partial [Candidatus Vecturithrix sp.]|nr:hypothetical protein [Candidatus Vecturithrix sp.]